MAGIIRTDSIQNSSTSNLITQTNTTTVTIGASGQTISLASGATASGFGASYTGVASWSTTVQSADFTAASGTGYFVNTTAGAITVTLPASPSAGSVVAISDYASTADTKRIVVANNGNKINGVAASYKITSAGLAITFVYVDATQGWKSVSQATINATGVSTSTFIIATGGTITTCGNDKIHTFTGAGTFYVCCAGSPAGSNTVNYLVVAGGGGGCSAIGGGGGGGGFRQSFPVPATTGVPVTGATAYPITVGAGGTGGNNPAPSPTVSATRGGDSIFSTITSTGGGAGFPGSPQQPGGSGGGSSHRGGSGGTGNTPPVSPPQGSPGGAAPVPGGFAGSGGGGIGGAGSSPDSAAACAQAGNGGNGLSTTISGCNQIYSAGGGGGGYIVCSPSVGIGGNCGQGGGGSGGVPSPSSTARRAGSGSRGGGGGGGGYSPVPTNNFGGNGGAGRVIIRYKYK